MQKIRCGLSYKIGELAQVFSENRYDFSAAAKVGLALLNFFGRQGRNASTQKILCVGGCGFFNFVEQQRRWFGSGPLQSSWASGVFLVTYCHYFSSLIALLCLLEAI